MRLENGTKNRLLSLLLIPVKEYVFTELGVSVGGVEWGGDGGGNMVK